MHIDQNPKPLSSCKQQLGFNFDNSWHRLLAGTYVSETPDKVPLSQLVVLNEDLAHELGLNADMLSQNPDWFTGNIAPPGAMPVTVAYAGHQFGGFCAQLGDGRAHLLGEHIVPTANTLERFDIQLKGSGRTSFSRGGDGKATMSAMLREYVISESMAALHIPTTRSLAVSLSGEKIERQGEYFWGAVLTRVASSHIRIGNFEFFAARQDIANLKALVDYAIDRHDPDLNDIFEYDIRIVRFFERVAQRQVRLIAKWMGVGFVHGVMNTDNMTISGETIDYGPCAFMDRFDPKMVFSSIDTGGRYAYANQPVILRWNLARFAESLLVLFEEYSEQEYKALLSRFKKVLDAVSLNYLQEWHEVMFQKLALQQENAHSVTLLNSFLQLIEGVDWTLSFRHLGMASMGDQKLFLKLFDKSNEKTQQALQWLTLWREHFDQSMAERLNLVNPLVIARNHKVEEALTLAERKDFSLFFALLEQVKTPFRDGPDKEAYSYEAPENLKKYITYCGT